LKTIKILLIILIIISGVNIFKEQIISHKTYLNEYIYQVNDNAAYSEVKTVEYVMVGRKQGWSNGVNELVFERPVMIIGASLIACVSSTQGIEARLTYGKYDFSVDTYSDDTLFHLSAVYSTSGGLATATVMLPSNRYYYVEEGERLIIDLFANAPGDGGSFLVYYVELEELK